MIKLILIRHGRTLWNSSGRFQGQSDIELSKEGLIQAEKLAENFPVDHVDRVYSSPLKRAFVTGKLIADKFNAPIIADENFREITFGKWEGLTYEQISQNWGEELQFMFDRPDMAKIPEGESFTQVQNRAVVGLEKVIKKAMKKDEDTVIAITAHGGILRTMLAYFLHMPLQYMWSLRQDNTAVNIITYYEKNKYSVELINSTAHLSTAQLPKLGRFS